MWGSVVAFILKVAGYVLEKLRARDAKRQTPEGKRDEIHEAIAKNDAGAVNVLLDDAVRRVPPARVRPAGDADDGAGDSRG